MTPRRWQTEAREVVIDHMLTTPHIPGAISVVTGGGKTAWLLLLLRRLRQLGRLPPKTVVATSRTELVGDLQRALFAGLDDRALGVGAAAIHADGDVVRAAIRSSSVVGRYDGHRKDVRPVTVTTYPSLARCLAAMGGADLLVCDEAHRSAAAQVSDVVASIPWRLGMSGTLYRGAEDETITAFDRCLYRYSAADAIRDGVIVPAEIRRGVVAAPAEGGGIDRDRALAGLLGELAADGGISTMGPGLVAVSSISEARWVADRMIEAGIRARAVSGEDSRSVRRDAILSVRDGRAEVIVTVALWGEGVDCPELRWLGLLDQRRRVQLVQLVGRVVRALHPERHAGAIAAFGIKGKAVIYDPCQIMAAQGLEADDALGERAPVVKPPSKAAQERAEVEAIVSDPTPYAVGCSPLERWTQGLYDAVVAVCGAPAARARPGPGLRALPASDAQWASLQRLLGALRWLIAGEDADRAREVVRAVAVARTASYGVVADLIDVLLMVRGWADRRVARQGQRYCRVSVGAPLASSGRTE